MYALFWKTSKLTSVSHAAKLLWQKHKERTASMPREWTEDGKGKLEDEQERWERRGMEKEKEKQVKVRRLKMVQDTVRWEKCSAVFSVLAWHQLFDLLACAYNVFLCLPLSESIIGPSDHHVAILTVGFLCTRFTLPLTHVRGLGS